MRAKPEDAAPLAALHAACFERGWPEADFAEHIARDLVLTDPDRRSLLVMREGGGQAEVLTLATHPDARGRGLAKALMEEAVRELAPPVLFLEVSEANAPAIALYTRLGFETFGRRPAYYKTESGRVAALLMQKRLV